LRLTARLNVDRIDRRKDNVAMKWTGICLVALAGAFSLHAQSPYRQTPVRSCRVADSTLGSNRVQKAQVGVLYDRTKDTTKLRVGDGFGLAAQGSMGGHGPSSNPVAQLDILLPAWQSEIILRTPSPHVVSVIIDDSVSRELSPVIVGTYFGPRRFMKLPIAAELNPPELVAIVRAQRVVVHVDSVTVSMHADDQRDLAALYTMMVCGTE